MRQLIIQVPRGNGKAVIDKLLRFEITQSLPKFVDR